MRKVLRPVMTIGLAAVVLVLCAATAFSVSDVQEDCMHHQCCAAHRRCISDCPNYDGEVDAECARSCVGRLRQCLRTTCRWTMQDMRENFGSDGPCD